MNDQESSVFSAYIGIGSNLGRAPDHVRQAIFEIAQWPEVSVVAESDLYLSAPVDAFGDDFVNAVICIRTALSPHELLAKLLHLENGFGRQRTYRNAPRVLDLDILLYGNEAIQSELLTIPHPRLTGRAFVLLPLLQIAPDISIPGKGLAQDYLEDVRDQRVIRLKY